MYRTSFRIMALAALAAGIGVLQFSDGFIRGSIGDVVVIIFIYALVKSFVDVSSGWLAIGVLALASFPELLQYLHVADRLHLTGAARIAVGTTFDPLDFLAYAVGAAGVYAIDVMVIRRWKVKMVEG